MDHQHDNSRLKSGATPVPQYPGEEEPRISNVKTKKPIDVFYEYM